MNGIIIKAISGFFYVDCENQIIECKARGSFRKENITPVTGDYVEFEFDGEKGIINKILPRKNKLVRPPVANIDKLIIVSSYETPAPNTFLIDRVVAIAESKNIEPIIVFNKTDLGNFDAIKSVYEKAGFKTIISSAVTGEGIEEIKECLKNSVCAFAGNSGVGKSSIINSIFPELELKTGDVSQKLGRGRHTTRDVTLYRVCGGYLADTPGFSSFDLERCERVYKQELPFAFREFRPYLNNCKFSPSCSHTCEKGCAVIAAKDSGEIAQSRHSSYCRLFEEIKDIKDWEIKKSNRYSQN